MKVTINKQKIITYKYSYEFTNERGVLQRVEGIGSLEEAKNHISKTMKKLKREKYKIIEK